MSPVFEKLTELHKQNNYSMSMPGHKRNVSFFAPNVFSLDFTEIGDNDNLHHPNGIIRSAEKEFARIMQCDECIMLVNGGSSGILTSLIATVSEGDFVLTASNCHKSVTNALVISGAVPVYISPKVSQNGIIGGITPEDVSLAFDKYPQIKAVVITSPTYEGFVSDIPKIAEVVHKYNSVLIVDETHGAHFAFHPSFPQPSIRLGADISVESWHKTLPAFNQSALLCVNTQRVDFAHVREAFSLTTTTSPSYILLSQMDYVRDLLENGNHFNSFVATLNEIRGSLGNCRTLELVKTEKMQACGIVDGDISKLTFSVNSTVSGGEIGKRLAEDYGYQIELAAPHHIIAMTSVADYAEMLWGFADAIREIDANLPYKEYRFNCSGGIVCPEITPRAAFYAPKYPCKIEDCVGKIAAEAVTPYPPDVPLIVAGEKITSEKLEALNEYISNKTEILGLKDGFINVMR